MEPLSGSNSQAILQKSDRLHIILLRTILPVGEGIEFRGAPDLLHMRGNATELPDVDPNGDGVGEAVSGVAKSARAHLSAAAQQITWETLSATICAFLATIMLFTRLLPLWSHFKG